MGDMFKRYTQQDYLSNLEVANVFYINRHAITSEDALCCACVRWFDDVVREPFGMIHIPNGGTRNPIEGAKLKRMGVRAGVADYLMMKDGSPRGFLEFKWGKNTLSSKQQDFKRYVAGKFPWAEIRSFDEFRKILKEWGYLK